MTDMQRRSHPIGTLPALVPVGLSVGFTVPDVVTASRVLAASPEGVQA